jgi:hypothetical protein
MEEKVKKSKPRRKKKPVAKRKIRTHMNFMVINSEEKFEKMLIPNALGQSYIDTFGLLTVRTKEEVENWLLSHNV